MKIMVSEVIGSSIGLVAEDGTKLYRAITPLKAGTKISVDFSGMRNIGATFLNNSIGRLLKDHTSKQLNELIDLDGLAPINKDLMNIVIENAKSFYAKKDLPNNEGKV